MAKKKKFKITGKQVRDWGWKIFVFVMLFGFLSPLLILFLNIILYL